MGRTISNAVLAEKIDALVKQSAERHSDNVSRMEEIRTDVKETRDEAKKTNGRLQKAERAIAVHWWALSLIGAGILLWSGALLTKVL